MSEVDPLEAAVGDCREVIREAHAATKDLRAAVREAKKELSAILEADLPSGGDGSAAQESGRQGRF